jgi:hypothetical protein
MLNMADVPWKHSKSHVLTPRRYGQRVPNLGIEPRTFCFRENGLQDRCSTTELIRQLCFLMESTKTRVPIPGVEPGPLG